MSEKATANRRSYMHSGFSSTEANNFTRKPIASLDDAIKEAKTLLEIEPAFIGSASYVNYIYEKSAYELGSLAIRGVIMPEKS